jgi:O-antigen/teichoic acid export membrane protein
MTRQTITDDPAAANAAATAYRSPDARRTPLPSEDRTPSPTARWQFVYTVGFSFAIVALQMAQGILLARLLGPQGRGEYATSILYVQLLLYVGLFGGLEVICRYAAEDAVDKMQLRRAALRLGMVTGMATTFMAVVLCVIALPADKRFLTPMALLCSLSLVGQHVMLMMTAVDRGSGQFTSYNVQRLIAAAAFPTLLLIAACVCEVSLIVTCAMFVAASLVSMAACVIGMPTPFRGPTSSTVPKLLRESRPYAFSMLVTDLFERLDLVLVLWLAPLVQQGFYASMVPVVFPLTVIPNTLGLFLFNAGASRHRRLSTRDVHRILASSLAVQTVITIAFMLVVGPLIRLLYTDAFSPAVTFAFWLAPVSAVKGIQQGLDGYLKGRGRPLAPVRARLVAALVMLVVTWMLFDTYGAVAVAMAALAGQLVCLFWLSAIVYADVNLSQGHSGDVNSDGDQAVDSRP